MTRAPAQWFERAWSGATPIIAEAPEAITMRGGNDDHRALTETKN